MGQSSHGALGPGARCGVLGGSQMIGPSVLSGAKADLLSRCLAVKAQGEEQVMR
jgi:hypothetical protein